MYATVPTAAPGLVRYSGSHFGYSSRFHPWASQCQFRQTKIQNLRVPAFGHEDVRGLDVSMDDALTVCGIERVCSFDGERKQRL